MLFLREGKRKTGQREHRGSHNNTRKYGEKSNSVVNTQVLKNSFLITVKFHTKR